MNTDHSVVSQVKSTDQGSLVSLNKTQIEGSFNKNQYINLLQHECLDLCLFLFTD